MNVFHPLLMVGCQGASFFLQAVKQGGILLIASYYTQVQESSIFLNISKMNIRDDFCQIIPTEPVG